MRSHAPLGRLQGAIDCNNAVCIGINGINGINGHRSDCFGLSLDLLGGRHEH